MMRPFMLSAAMVLGTMSGVAQAEPVTNGNTVGGWVVAESTHSEQGMPGSLGQGPSAFKPWRREAEAWFTLGLSVWEYFAAPIAAVCGSQSTRASPIPSSSV